MAEALRWPEMFLVRGCRGAGSGRAWGDWWRRPRTGCGRGAASKVDLQVRVDSVLTIGFYERLGVAVEDRVSLGKRL